MRSRLSKSPVGAPVTLTDNFEVYEYESFLLEGAIDEPWKAYWAAHIADFAFRVEARNPYTTGDGFEKIRELIAEGLNRAGYSAQASYLRRLESEASFNRAVIAQYTADTALFEDVNSILRRGHSDESISTHPLVPWIAHLNATLRNEAEFGATAYRGTDLSPLQSAQYTVGKLFIWTSFTSLSMSRAACLEGNTLFKVTPRSAISEHGKRAARVIAPYSEHPEEEEVLLPVACAFRVASRESVADGRTVIGLDLLDHN